METPCKCNLNTQDWHECMSAEDERRALRTVLEGCFWVEANMNDTFGFACADSERIKFDDIVCLLPLIHRYGHHVLTAYAAIKRTEKAGQRVDPISCRCCHDGEEYKVARTEIENMEQFPYTNFGGSA